MMIQILRALASLQRSQWFERRRLARIQDVKLKRIVNHAYHNVPFYNNLYRTHGINPINFEGVSDLSKLPRVTRDDLQREPLETRTSTDADLSACMPTITSGTTGSPVQVYDDPFSVPYRDAQNLRLLWAYGLRPYHKLCKMRVGDPTTLKPKPFLSEVGLWGFLRRHSLNEILYDSSLDDAIESIANCKPDVIFGMGSYLRVLLERSKPLGRSLESRIAITTGEVLDRLTRSSIEDGLHAVVYDHYGMEEVGGSVAWECPTHSGYHINDETVILEFLRDGQPVGPGEPGEVCITSLTHTATPIIRYETGDIATPIGEECECGRGLSMLKDVQGRILDALVTRNGTYLFTIISRLQEVPGLEQFRVNQNKDFSVDMHVRIAKGMEATTRARLGDICAELLEDMPVRIIQAEHFDQALGKKFRIVESSLTTGNQNQELVYSKDRTH